MTIWSMLWRIRERQDLHTPVRSYWLGRRRTLIAYLGWGSGQVLGEVQPNSGAGHRQDVLDKSVHTGKHDPPPIGE